MKMSKLSQQQAKRDALPSRVEHVPISPRAAHRRDLSGEDVSSHTNLLAVAQHLHFTPPKGDVSMEEPAPRPMYSVPVPTQTPLPLLSSNLSKRSDDEDPMPLPSVLRPSPSPKMDRDVSPSSANKNASKNKSTVSVEVKASLRFPLRSHSAGTSRANTNTASIEKPHVAAPCARASTPRAGGEQRHISAARQGRRAASPLPSSGLAAVEKKLNIMHQVITHDPLLRQAMDVEHAHNVLMEMDRIVRDGLYEQQQANVSDDINVPCFGNAKGHAVEENASPVRRNTSAAPTHVSQQVVGGNDASSSPLNLVRSVVLATTAGSSSPRKKSAVKFALGSPSPSTAAAGQGGCRDSSSPTAGSPSRADVAKYRVAWKALVMRCKGSLSEQELELLSNDTVLRLAGSMKLDAKDLCRIELFLKYRGPVDHGHRPCIVDSHLL